MLPPGTDELIARALAEDIGDGDHTALSTVPASAKGAARLLVKQDGVIAGVELAQAVCAAYDPALKIRVLIQDGARVVRNDVAFTVSGPARSILVV
ncbi:MAG TPA: nicotinate-nucleotide diphosphorylase (carboxylating), partial [Flavobacteriales bacterium]